MVKIMELFEGQLLKQRYLLERALDPSEQEWVARDDVSGQRVMVKFLLTHNASNTEHITALVQNIKLLNEMASVFAKIYDVGEKDGIPYLVSGYINGTALKNFSAQAVASLDEQKAWDYFNALTHAVAALHKNRVTVNQLDDNDIFINPAEGIMLNPGDILPLEMGSAELDIKILADVFKVLFLDKAEESFRAQAFLAKMVNNQWEYQTVEDLIGALEEYSHPEEIEKEQMFVPEAVATNNLFSYFKPLVIIGIAIGIVLILTTMFVYLTNDVDVKTAPNDSLQGQVIVPDFIGDDIKAAQDKADDARINLNTERRQIEFDSPPGTVLFQDIRPGQTVAEEAEVSVTISEN